MNLILDEQGDGESLPDTPPNEAAADAHQDPAVKIANKASHPFSLDIKVSVFMEIQYHPHDHDNPQHIHKHRDHHHFPGLDHPYHYYVE